MRNSGNLLLAALSEADAEVLRPHLKPVDFEHEKVLFQAGEEVTDIYFPTGAIVSLVAGRISSKPPMMSSSMVATDRPVRRPPTSGPGSGPTGQLSPAALFSIEY